MKAIRLRPHNMLCERFLEMEFPERGAEFREVEQRIRNLIRLSDEALIEIVQGVDELCQVCPLCHAGRCQHPHGNEEAVRKWDDILLKALGISYSDKNTAKQWRTIIEEKAPLDFCKMRCPWKSNCSVEAISSTHP